MSADENVLLSEDRGAVRLLTMNRPSKLNALDTRLSRALLDALLAADEDDAIRALVLTGAGRSFCAGADTSEFSSLTPDDPDAVLARADLTTRLQAQFPRLKKPVVAAARGHALGGGAGLLLASDLVVAAPSLKLGYPEMAHGIVPAIVMTGLVRQLGPKPAFELVGLGKPIGAERARELGLVNRIADEEALVDVALELATAMAEVSPLAMRTTKELFYRVMELPYDQAILAGRDANVMMRGFAKRKDP
jgi:enoyl-CoA hydratase/carnithine racemase